MAKLRTDDVGRAIPSDASPTPTTIAAAALSIDRARTPAEVRAVVRWCAAAGRSDAAELRRIALQSDDPLVAGNAIRALGRVGAFACETELLALLRDARPRIRHEAIRALGKSGDPDAVAALAPIVAGDDLTARSLAIDALGTLGGDEARAILVAARSGRSLQSDDVAFLGAAIRRDAARPGVLQATRVAASRDP